MNKIKDEEFELIANKYYKMLINIANKYVRDILTAQEIVQEVFLKFYRAHKTFETEEHMKYWLIRVTINCSLDVLKHQKKKVSIDEEYISNLPNAQDCDDKKNELIYNCVCSLKDSYKAIIILYYYENYSIKEIANILNISETNAQSRLYNARKKLKNLIDERS